MANMVGTAVRAAGGVLLALLLARCAAPLPGTPEPAPIPTPTPTPPPAVAILTVDGLRPDALFQTAAPNILALARRGAFTWEARTVLPSTTLPGHASLLSGYEPAVHGITWDDSRPGRGTITVPTVFSIARRAGLHTVMVVGKEKLAQLNAPGSVDSYVLALRGDQDVANEAIARAGTGFDLMLVHLPEIDLVGHAKGWLSAGYLQQVTRTDEAVGRILAALPETTTVILTADHGGQGTTHGSGAAWDMTIPWIIAGPEVVAGRYLTTRVKTVDTAATAAHVLKLALPPNAAGVPVLEAFGLETLSAAWSRGAPGPAAPAPASEGSPAP